MEGFSEGILGGSAADEFLIPFVELSDAFAQKSLFFLLPPALLLHIFGNVLKKVIVKNKPIPRQFAALRHDLEVGNLEHPGSEVRAEFEFMRFTPKDGIGLLHDILRLCAIAKK